MSGVFISYRREDSGGYAGRLFDILTMHYGRENTFMDLDAIRGGDNFVSVIEEKIGQCDVLLAVIGERWLTITGSDGTRRLDDTGDFVRLEIAKALERGVRVIPVLVSKATMPGQESLPEDLRPLSLREAIDIRDEHFRDDADRLIDLLNKVDPHLGKRPWKAKSKLFPAIAGVLVVAAVVSGFLLFEHGRTAATNDPTTAGAGSAAQSQAAPAGGASTAAVNSANAAKPTTPVNAPANIAGKWKATVTYDWPGAVYPETFNFEVDGNELSGTASFLQADRGIFDGKIEGNRVSFTTKT
jgi:hypothetical protein